jgi:hypothetical protein
VLPYVTLGLARDAVRDGWGNFFSYHVSNTNITAASSGNWSANTDWTRTAWFRPGNTGLITVNERSGATVTPVATSIVTVVVSHGRNGLGAYTIGGTRNTLPAVGADEEDNTDGDTTYFRRELTADDAATGGPFDDQVLFLSANDLLEPLFRDGSLRAPASVTNDALQKVKLTVIGHAMGFLSGHGGSTCTNASATVKCRLIVSADISNGVSEAGNNDALLPYVDLGMSLSEAMDPWGMRYRYKPNTAVITNGWGYGIGSGAPSANTLAMQIYSQGPNRTDDGGVGDDISVSVAVGEVRGYMATLLP